ncbi:trypsin-like peptidase domain-containing protein [Streptomyces sp. NBC_00140]|uniref:trypsin-like peptidase domain-containing protein n=1 Tax=Streptomyces sp. NBC_00140 TaxID=2975664 RepID=UPI002258D757|nr:trypsin-like peptidase domain-containing protein [Streptomyces sp. NBC_00140]MCX5328033.1 hypothetical protein [Streptomyces sp. NBC_00140]
MTSPSLLAQRPSWLVRFPRAHGDGAAGAGVLVGTRHVVTCAHVLDKQFGREGPEPGRSPEAPAQVVEVEFPFADKDGSPGTRMRATVVGWVPIAADGSGDAALLELETELDLTPDPEPAPKDKQSVAYTPAPLACPPALSGHQFSVHGFPHGNPAARQVTGVLRGASGQEGPWVQLDPEGAAGWAIEVGFSGAPVFDHNREAVVGIVVIRDDHRTGHMIPMSYLRRLWPEVGNNCRWRLDLEASYRTHWHPRARGSEPNSRTKEWFFTGRTEACRVIRDWLEGTNAALSEHSMLLVTGGPGSGKSALLAHSLVASDPLLSRTVPTSGPCPPIGAFDAAVYLKGRTCDEVTAQLARALDVTASDSDELVAAVSEFPDGKRFTVLADAVEEAASQDEAVEIAALLRDLGNTGQVRVLAAVRTTPAGASRQEILAAFGRSTPRIDLEDSRYLHRPDVAEYVARRLVSEQAVSARYRAYRPDQLQAIGEKVARKARYNFLIAQLTTGWLTDPRGQQSGPDDPKWETELPETVGQAMDRYLRTCRPDTDTVKRLLTALAYARGDGLPRGDTWLRMADALAPDDEEPVRDLGKVFKSAAQHLVERVNERSGPHTYRLFHDALDQHLRETLKLEHHAPEAAITAALTDAVPCGPDGERAWAEADAYTRDHLASHAAAAGQLDGLINDAEYLVHATPRQLKQQLRHTVTESARMGSAVYRSSIHLHAKATPAIRRQFLALDAARAGATSLQQGLTFHIPQNNWIVQWATGADFSQELRETMTGHGSGAWAIVCTNLNGLPAAVTGYADGRVRVWDLTSGMPIDQPLVEPTEYSRGVEAIACIDLNGRTAALIANDFETVQVLDLTSGAPIGHPLVTGIHGGVGAIACTSLNGVPVAVIGGRSRKLEVWDLTSSSPIRTITANTRGVTAIACTDLNGTPAAVASYADGTVQVWDLASGTQVGTLTGHASRGWAIACTDLNGTPVAVTGHENGAVHVWDLPSGNMIRSLAAHRGEVKAVTCTRANGRPVAVTGGAGAVRVWDLASGKLLRDLTGHTGKVEAVTCTHVEGTLVAVTGSQDGTMRIWDLTPRTSARSFTGHTSAMRAVACTHLNGIPVAVTGGDSTARVWDLNSGNIIRSLTGHTGQVNAVTCTHLNGTPVAVTGGDRTVRVWDLTSGTSIGQPLHGHIGAVSAVACTLIDGAPAAVTGTTHGRMRVWDLTSGETIGLPFDAYPLSPGKKYEPSDDPFDVYPPPKWQQWVVWTIACAELDGTPVAVTGGEHPTVLIWDLTTRRPVQALTGHKQRVRALACTYLDGTPVAITGDRAGTVRMWDLTSGTLIRSFTGHRGEVCAVTCTEVDGVPVAVTADAVATVQVWNLQTGKRTGVIFATDPKAVAVTGEEHLVVGMGRDIAVFGKETVF